MSTDVDGTGRGPEEWALLKANASRLAAMRERNALRGFFRSHKWRFVDLAFVLKELGFLRAIMFETKEGFTLYMGEVRKLHTRLEQHDYGIRFGLYLHFDMKLTLAHIQNAVEASCMEYDRGTDRFKKRVWLSNPYVKRDVLMTPRIVPARTKLEPVIIAIGKLLGVTPAENGMLAFRSMDLVMQDLLARDSGCLRMPTLPEFYGGLRLPIVISRDATGKGSLQFTTAAVRSPWMSKSAQRLHIFGFGNCGDDRSGSARVFGTNVEAINDMVEAAAEGKPTLVTMDGVEQSIFVDPHFTDDVSCLRHGEHLANSGWCGCPRDLALRQSPAKPQSVPAMRLLVSREGSCRELSCVQREVLSHTIVKGETLPRPCIAPGCKFGHNRATVLAEYYALLKEEAVLAADKTKAGKIKFSTWRMKHAWKGPTPHFNVPPGLYGRPFLRHHFRKQILDALHLALLGLPKTPWKFGIKNNASDDARVQLSEQLAAWKHPLDMKRKDDGRVREQKWFTGEKFISFCAGTGGSPGGPNAIATLVMIIADDLMLRGVDHGSGDAVRLAAPAAGRGSTPGGRGGAARGGRGRGRGGSLADRLSAGHAHASLVDGGVPAPGVVQASRVQLQHTPSAFEAAADQDDLLTIRQIYGSRAQTLINALLSFDAFFAWYYPFKKSVGYLCPMEEREQRALDNCCKAIDMQEMFERISAANNGHGSFLPHGAVFKVTLLTAHPSPHSR